MMDDTHHKIACALNEGSEQEYSFLDSTSKRRQYISAIIISLGAVSSGAVVGWTSPVLPQITSQDPDINEGLLISDTEGAVVGCMMAVGAVFGALPAGYVSDRFGCKKLAYILTLLFLLNLIIISVSNGVYLIYFARFIGGFAAGAASVCVPVYIVEIAHDSIRGILGSLFQVSFVVGILIVNALGISLTWTELSLCLMIFPMMNFFGLFFVPESHMYLLKIGDHHGAKISYKYFNGSSISMPQDYEKQKEIPYMQLLKVPKNLKALLVGMGLVGCQQLSGVNAVLFYTSNIFNAAGTSLPATISAVIVTGVQVIMAFVSAAYVDKLNRRFYLITSAIGAIISLILLGMYFHLDLYAISFTGFTYIPIISLVLFIASFSVGLGPIPWLMMSELYAPEFKGFGCGFVSLFNWFLVFLITLGFPVVCEAIGEHFTFYLFGCFNLMALLFAIYFVPETRGKSFKQIQDILSK